MAKGGELRALDPQGRPYGTLEAFTRSDQFARTYAVLEVTPPALDDIADQVDPLPARVWEDSWIVDCPDCGGAEFVFLETPLMWCHSCGNVTAGHKWRRVKLPDELEAIQAILDKRPLRTQRNWEWETLDELRAENVEHGDPV